MLEKKRKYLVYKEGNSNLKVLDGTKLILNKCKQIVDHKNTFKSMVENINKRLVENIYL